MLRRSSSSGISLPLEVEELSESDTSSSSRRYLTLGHSADSLRS